MIWINYGYIDNERTYPGMTAEQVIADIARSGVIVEDWSETDE